MSKAPLSPMSAKQLADERGVDEPIEAPPVTEAPEKEFAPRPVAPPVAPGPVAPAPVTAAPAVGNYAGDEPGKKKIDPVKENGEIFKNWPKPALAILATGEQHGYLEPCGCAGLENMKGGLGRRHTLLKKLRGDGWPVVAVDLGGQVRRFGRQAEIQFHRTADALRTMQYDAVGLGADDLRLPVDDVLADLADPKNGFVSANVAVYEGIPPRYLVVERGGRKIGITSILGKGPDYRDKVKTRDIAIQDASAALREVLPELDKKCELIVLLSHASLEESKALAAAYPAIDVVVSAGGQTPPPGEPTALNEGKTWLVEAGHKGMYAAVTAWFDDEKEPRRLQRVPIDSRFADSPEIHRLRTAMQDQLREAGWEGLGLKPAAPKRDAHFVGSEKCGECHTKAYAVWEKTPHAHATQSIVELDPPRQFDPECVSCHVTGWEPQRFSPLKGGFLSLDKTPKLLGNGCENCHGPGSKHAAVEAGEMQATPQQQMSLRLEMRLSKEQAKKQPDEVGRTTCISCHDLDNSPDYIQHGFEAYWPRVEHKGKD
ncbi:MAG: hypothetical protein HYS13_24840 [Planctomycetia bacterium]|nr:hypothetical protein [Planctomycetia bacterium]